jgi:hypothetical protein
VLYYNDSLDGYLDIEPSPAGRTTIRYVGEYVLEGQDCRSPVDHCTVSVVDRVNLTTGEVTRLYSRVIPQDSQANWYDVDRVDEDRILVADLYGDRVYVYNLTSDLVEWEWEAQSAYAVERGGEFPREWVNVVNVQWLSDGRIMIVLEHMNQVIFVDHQTGLDHRWTLGSANETDILYEPLDADYIPPEHGGPAVLVADSKNDRVVEYQFENGSWNQTWVWQDEGLRWPRDVDRLPNGHTLVVDAKGHRVVEVDIEGQVVWSLPFYAGMDAERFGTGDGSTGGPSADRAGLEPRNDDAASVGNARGSAGRGVPAVLIRVVAILNPPWLSFQAVLGLGAITTVMTVWVGLEWWWRGYRLELRSPIEFKK